MPILKNLFFQHVRIAGACNVSVCHFWHPHHGSTVTVLRWWGCQKCLSGRCPTPTTLHLSRSSPQRHTTTVVGDICSWVSFFKTHTFKDLVEAVRKDIFNSARNNRCHDPTAANTTPVTQKDSHLSPHHIWNVIYSAQSNRCHDPTSPNAAPVTQKDSHP